MKYGKVKAVRLIHKHLAGPLICEKHPAATIAFETLKATFYVRLYKLRTVPASDLLRTKKNKQDKKPFD